MMGIEKSFKLKALFCGKWEMERDSWQVDESSKPWKGITRHVKWESKYVAPYLE
jgi:hypothetical protein